MAKQQVPIDSEELDLGLFDPPHQGETGDGEAATGVATALDQDCLEAVLGDWMVHLVSDPISEVISHRLGFWSFLGRFLVHGKVIGIEGLEYEFLRIPKSEILWIVWIKLVRYQIEE